MQTAARTILYKPTTRYMTETEEAEVRTYADGLLARLPVLTLVEENEKPIVDEALNRLMARHPQLVRNHGADTEQRGRRDMTFVYRYAAMAMVLDDQDLVRDKVAVWMRTIVLALMPKEPMIYGYQQLIEGVKARFEEPVARLFVPQIEIVLNELMSERSDV